MTTPPQLAALDFITAMSHFKAGREKDARDELRVGLGRFSTQVPQPTVDDIPSPENYFVCEILRREAVGLIDPGKK